MKVILSRKGFDSQYGGDAQPDTSRWNNVVITNTIKR